MAANGRRTLVGDDEGGGDHDFIDAKKAITKGVRQDGPPIAPIICYCLASIMMTLANKFVVSGTDFSMNFLLLCMQASVSVSCVWTVKRAGVITFREFDLQDAKAWFPVSFMLVGVIYTGSKSLQYLSIPVYTIFKNLTIILVAYGEVLWFGGKVTALTLVSFVFMILSSLLAAWPDVRSALGGSAPATGSFAPLTDTMQLLSKLNVGYVWILVNCIASATYVLSMRQRIKGTGFSDWDTMFYNNLLSIPVLAMFSISLEDWGWENLTRNFPAETRAVLLSAIAFSGATAVGISFTTAWCVRATSSTTYSMVGALNKLPVAASGMIFFGEAVTTGSVSAVCVGFVAGILYAVAKDRQRRDSRHYLGQQHLRHGRRTVGVGSIIPLSLRRPS